ncbi:MAG: hypothetical protein EPO25_17505 [Gammaproteobacteria bacterium]|nr:MAG: hypothetical protein EPO25_17505 [Gammaproteobacteria bacterium]
MRESFTSFGVQGGPAGCGGGSDGGGGSSPGGSAGGGGWAGCCCGEVGGELDKPGNFSRPGRGCGAAGVVLLCGTAPDRVQLIAPKPSQKPWSQTFPSTSVLVGVAAPMS